MLSGTLARRTLAEPLENGIATALALAVLILVVRPVFGAHLKPVVSLVDWRLGRRSASYTPIGQSRIW